VFSALSLGAVVIAAVPATHCSRGTSDGSSAAPPAGAAAKAAPDAAPFPAPPKGFVSTTTTLINLSPPAQIQAEKFRCVCGCGLSLGECTCRKTPGSIDMKSYLQGLVDRKLDPAEIGKEMVAKYGPEVLR